MTITGIKSQVKNPERVSIYIDGAYYFSLTKNQLLDSKLRLNQEITEAEIADFKNLSDYGKLLEKTLNYLAIRPRSRRELVDYFWRKKIDDSQKTKILDFLESKNYINDAEFAKAWVRSRQLTKLVSKKRLILELRQKGVADDCAQIALAEYKHDDTGVLRDLIAKKRTQTRYKDPQKLMQYLARQGFSYDDIKFAMSQEA